MDKFSDNLLLIADSGSTKTDWFLLDSNTPLRHFSTQGLNPFHQSEEVMLDIVKGELYVEASQTCPCISDVGTIRFYGAGCRGEAIETMGNVLSEVFPRCTMIIVGSDLHAAAHALCGNDEGIACILGTGANSCLYDGKTIVNNVSPLGYILGDEGSGAVLGKLFLNALFKGNMPEALRKEFLEQQGLTIDDIIRKVYREPMANRWLASLSPFIHEHLYVEEVKSLVVNNFVEFFRKNIDHYERPDLPVGAVGSVAFYYREQLEEAARICGYTLGKVMKSPFGDIASKL